MKVGRKKGCSAWNKGMPRPHSVRRKVSAGLRRYFANLSGIGKRNYRKSRLVAGKGISRALKGRPSKLKGRTYVEIFGVRKAAKLKLERSIALKGIKRSAATRAKLVVARSKQVIPFKDTVPEQLTAVFLQSRQLRFEKHGLIANCSHQFDIVLRALKIAIEVDGCYWHGCFKCLHKLSQPAREQRARDRWWEKKAAKVGWRVVRIWEHDVRVGKFTVLCDALGLVEPSSGVPHGKSNSAR